MDDAVVERFDAQDQAARAWRSAADATLQRIEGHLAALNGRVRGVETWQASTDPMLDSLNERCDANADRTEKNEGRIDEHQSWIDRTEGGMSARTTMILHIVTAVGMLMSVAGTILAVVKVFAKS